MLILIGIAVVVLVAFALFVLRYEAIERNRDVERETAKRAR
jgi:heme/copper-type cytochrome/quinol oxidase subunit 2